MSRRRFACEVAGIGLFGFLGLVQGCATITGSEMQSVSVTTETDRGERLYQARCTVRNDKGAWEVVTPGSISVARSARDLLVECRRLGHPDGLLRAISRAGGGMFGNIILGGAIGAAVDHDKGTGYDYPTLLHVRMGRMNVVDMRQEQGVQGEQPGQQR